MPGRLSTYKSISHTKEDFSVINKAMDWWTKKHHMKISAAKMVRIAIEEYLEKHSVK